MPDWSYQTLFRPLLFRLPVRVARGVTLRAMGALSRLPGGPLLIRTLGHMEQTPLLRSELGQLAVRYPVGLSGAVDPEGVAHRALAQFGFGYFELGPVTAHPASGGGEIALARETEDIVYERGEETIGVAQAAALLGGRRSARRRMPYIVRLRPQPDAPPRQAAAELGRLAAALAPLADGFFVEAPAEGWSEERTAAYFAAAYAAVRAAGEDKPLLACLPAEAPDERFAALLRAARELPWAGCVVRGGRRTADGWRIGRSAGPETMRRIRQARAELPPGRAIVAAGGVHEPRDALGAVDAGADYVQLDSGLVYAGPGLPKRVNDAIAHRRTRGETPAPLPSFWRNWGWMWLLGAAMICGGLIAWAIAATSVLLPYDEAFLGVTRSDIAAWNGRLLHFMSHDRITLAGTMISIGIFYRQLAVHGLRHGLHWARTALLASGIVGFSSFFLYLGYGYFDPLHALAAALLLPMFLLSMNGAQDRPPLQRPNVANDRLWRRAQWGQLCWVVLGFSLLAGGFVIALIGITHVFVPTDLAYIGLSAAQLDEWNERLIPLIAHDRAGFGGALFSLAVALTAAALWGIGQGERWLWYAWLFGGMPGFASGFAVHYHIGYRDFWHLLPAYFAFALYVAGLILLYPYMMKDARSDEGGER